MLYDKKISNVVTCDGWTSFLPLPIIEGFSGDEDACEMHNQKRCIQCMLSDGTHIGYVV